MGGMISGASQIAQGLNNEQAQGQGGRAAMEWNDQGRQVLQSTYDENSANYKPYIQGGATAEGQLQQGTAPGGELQRQYTLADYQADPSYAFTRQQGMQAIGNANSVRGGALSGGTAKALANYGLNMANNSFGQSRADFEQRQSRNFGQLSSMAGQGLGATQGLGQLGQHFSDQMNDADINQGNTQKNMILGQAAGRNQVYGGFGSMATSAASSMGTGMGTGS